MSSIRDAVREERWRQIHGLIRRIRDNSKKRFLTQMFAGCRR